MKKSLLLITFLVFTLYCNAKKPYTFRLNDNQAAQSTYSYKIGQNNSIHFVVAKNKDSKKFDLIPFFVDASKMVKQLETLSFKEDPNIIAFHANNNTITALTYNDKTLTILDYDVNTAKARIKEIKDYQEPTSTFSLDNKTVIVRPESNKINDLIIDQITNTETITNTKINVPTANASDYNTITKIPAAAINTNEFVKNGAILISRSYFENNKLIITYDDRNKGVTNTMIVDASTGSATFNKFDNAFKKQRQLTSYVKNNILFSTANDKENSNLKAFDLLTGIEKFNFDMKKDLSKFFKPGKLQKDFMDAASKYDMKPTVTVNTAGKNYAVRIDLVNIYTYQYFDHLHFAMFMHNNLMQMRLYQQSPQQLRHLQRGPNSSNINFDFEEEKEYSLTIPLSNDLKLLEDTELLTDYKNIDKEKYMKPFWEKKTVTNFSADFFDNEMRYIYQDKKTREFIIDTLTF